MTGERIFRDEVTALQWCAFTWTRTDIAGLDYATALCMGMAEDGSDYCERHGREVGSS